jgi:hypothetical protein
VFETHNGRSALVAGTALHAPWRHSVPAIDLFPNSYCEVDLVPHAH